MRVVKHIKDIRMQGRCRECCNILEGDPNDFSLEFVRWEGRCPVCQKETVIEDVRTVYTYCDGTEIVVENVIL